MVVTNYTMWQHRNMLFDVLVKIRIKNYGPKTMAIVVCIVWLHTNYGYN